jgi:Arc/MetJ family transcription regulator
MCILVHMSRTNVDIDDGLISRVMKRYDLKTKREAVDFALRRLDVEPMSVDEMLAMEGSGWDGDLDAMRAGSRAPELPHDLPGD